MYFIFENLINQEDCDKLNKVALSFMDNKKLRLEADNNFYKNSYGAAQIAEYETLLHQLTPKIKEVTGLYNITPENSYTRIYYNGATLGKHVDRANLDFTLSLCTFSNLDFYWDLFFQTPEKEILSWPSKPGDAALILGTKMLHWREPLVCRDDQYAIMSFYHWKINKKNIKFI